MTPDRLPVQPQDPRPVRPRDRLGRPLPFDADPDLVAEPVPEHPGLSSQEAWSAALDYLDRDLPFHAHEVLEQRWRCCPAEERQAWQGLAQWAAALTHRARGNPVGAQRVAQRAQARLAPPTTLPEPVDAALVRASLDWLTDASDRTPY